MGRPRIYTYEKLVGWHNQYGSLTAAAKAHGAHPSTYLNAAKALARQDRDPLGLFSRRAMQARVNEALRRGTDTNRQVSDEEIQSALNQTRGNIYAAAKLLGRHRNVIYARLKRNPSLQLPRDG